MLSVFTRLVLSKEAEGSIPLSSVTFLALALGAGRKGNH